MSRDERKKEKIKQAGEMHTRPARKQLIQHFKLISLKAGCQALPSRSGDFDFMKLEKYGRYWAVYDLDDNLVCVTVYKKGALEVIRRLSVNRLSKNYILTK